MVVFEVCDLSKRATCKPEDEIKEALKWTYLMVMENEQFYDHTAYPGSEEQYQQFSKVTWYPVSRFEE